MAQKGMISPFESSLIRKLQPDSSQLPQPVISYGLSSYGYDIRLSGSEFRIFRHIPGTVIDPKNFNPQNLESTQLHTDESGSYFILPAHSYGLGVALEKLEVPANITVICIGKCLTGDTKIVDAATGAYLPIKEFAGGQTATYSEEKGIIKTAATAVIPQGVKPIYQVTTKKGAVIQATSNHPFLTETGWKPLEELTSGVKIATPKSIPIFGNGDLTIDEATLLGLMISEGQCHTPGNSPIFTSEDEVLVNTLKSCVKTVLDQEVTYKGKDFGYRLVNQVGRGGVVTHNRANLWLQSYALNVGALEKFVPQQVFTAPKVVVAAFLRALFSGDGGVYLVGESTRAKPTLAVEYCSISERLIRDVHHLLLRFGIPSQIRVRKPGNGRNAYVLAFQSSEAVLKFFNEIGFLPDSIKQRRFEEKMYSILLATKSRPQVHDHILWDEIKSIECAGMEEVYDISVPGLENFVANDIIVHNSTYARCGIIANLTPAEAAWRGHLTLEFSNSSSADCRIYANEGVVQLLFLEGEPCAVSYETRRGKYQDQLEIVTIARV
ncbi:deoxycytidine triphosphate deaminase [Dolichospermum compactum NIES-806]|uniref:Deoxycytidine triphosphate deaminase n=1 Tax=Dolichospermum compactum NIES-806 TaxID=1973481 RepID=A0A1Z4V2S5_9CYAN|nr:deoxycytidine triphosphate deaminase [Dolichospermum compactum NIES-806]